MPNDTMKSGAAEVRPFAEELRARDARPANLLAELEAVRELSHLIATEPQAAVQRALEMALALCGAGSARLGLIQTDADGETGLAWTALAGAVAPHCGVLPGDVFPFALDFDQHRAILISRPGPWLPELELVAPAIHEALVVPLTDGTLRPIGMLLVMSHDAAVRFCATDAQILERLAAQMVLALKVARDAAEHARALEARDAALQDAHHRAKNTIQVAASLLRTQTSRSRSPEARAALTEAVSRLNVLVGVHELLLRSTRQPTVGLSALMGTLAEGLRQSFPEMAGHVQLIVQVDGMSLDPDCAIPLALVVNEAVTNAYKHAFPDGRRGEIGVSLEKVGLDGTGVLALTVWDNGIGLPPKGRDGSLGLTLIRRFGQQLGGELTLSGEGSGGTTVTLRLPVSPS